MAIKKILTDLEVNGKIGIGMVPSNYIDMDVTNVENDSTIGINLDINKENTSGAGFASNINGIKAYSKGNSSETIVNIAGVWGKAEHIGTGRTYYITGGTNRAYHSGTGDSSSISGTFSEAKVGGTGAGDHPYLIGVNSVAKLDNPNADVQFLQGQHCTIQLNAGEVTDNAMCLILDLDHTGGTISGDFEYLRIQNDTFNSSVGGTARAINSLSTLRSEFAGTIQAPRFDLGNSDNYLRENSGDIELYGDASVIITSGDGMSIEMSDVIDITGGGNIVSDSDFTAASIIKSGGASTEFLKADGSVDTNTYLTSADVTDSQWDDVTGGINYASGNVGIGTIGPSEKLEVDGNVKNNNNQGFVSENVAGSTRTLLKLGSSNVLRIKGNDSESSDNGISIAGGGNVGIGTTDPQEKLDISAGDIRLDDQYSINWATDDANIGRVRISGNEVPDTILFATDNQERVRITNSGTGIGTNDPQARLDVDGGIRMGDDTTTASADNEGTMRYYTDINGSYMDICMQYQNSGTPANDYKWTNVVRHIFPS